MLRRKRLFASELFVGGWAWLLLFRCPWTDGLGSQRLGPIASGGNGEAGNVGGFSDMPAFLAGTIQHFQDDQAQTNFWATLWPKPISWAPN